MVSIMANGQTIDGPGVVSMAGLGVQPSIGAAAFAYRACGRREGTLTLSIGDLPADVGHVLVAGGTWAVATALGVDFGAVGRVAAATHETSFAQELLHYRSAASAVGLPDGTVGFQGEPVLQVFAPLVELFLLEPLIASVVRVGTTAATLAGRLVDAARTRPVLLLRAGESAEGVLAESAAIGGMRIGRAAVEVAPVVIEATAIQVASAVTPSEATFRALVEQRGSLVLPLGDRGAQLIHAAMRAVKETSAHDRFAAVLLDGSDLGEHARYVRRLLDDGGMTNTKIAVMTEADEVAVSELSARSPVDLYAMSAISLLSAPPDGCGPIHVTSRITGLDSAPARPLQIYRSDHFDHDVVAYAEEPADPGATPLLKKVAQAGALLASRSGEEPAVAGRQRAMGQQRRLPSRFSLRRKAARYPVTLSQAVCSDREAGLPSADDVKSALPVD